MLKISVRYWLFIIVVMGVLISPWRAWAQSQTPALSIVRDTEIEKILAQWAEPMYKAAGLNANAMRVVLVQDDDLNAFTAGGMDIFMTTGLIMQAESPDEIVGVLAHETGHIVGGHILSIGNKLKTSSYETLISTILGVGAGLLSGNGQVGAAITSFGRAGALNNFLTYSRLEESAADQAAITFLEESRLPTSGLVSFMEKLEDQELLPPSQQRAFARTHPVTRDRIAALLHRTRNNAATNTLSLKASELDRIQAKLLAFINSDRALHKYSSGTDALSLMARSIVYYRLNHVSEALKNVEAWIALEPNNPYAYELQGQVLKDAGRAKEAVLAYDKALAITPRAALIRIDAGHALLETGDEALVDKAIRYLASAIETERRSGFAFRLLATAYARKGLEPEAQIYLAEEALLRGDDKRARQLVEMAAPKLSINSPLRRRMTDLDLLLDTLDTKDEDR